MSSIRFEHREAVTSLLRVLRSFLANELTTAELLERFSGQVHVYALDGHEDAEGPISRDELMATPSLRFLFEAEAILGLVFDEESPENDTAAYLAAGRIKISDVRQRITEALARVAVDLALRDDP